MIEGTDTAQPVSAPGPATERGMDPRGRPPRRRRRSIRRLPRRRPPRGYWDTRRTSPGRESGDARRGRRERGPFYAALDLGTNNCRLLIAEPSRRGFRVVDSFSRIVRLGEGVAQTGA